MALSTSGIVLPKSVVPVIGTKAKDSSVIAALSPAKPEIFADETYLVFNGNSEAEVVAEGAQKGAYAQTASPVVANRATIQTTTRVSNQLKWADEDNQLQIVDSIIADQARAMGRALDYLAFHAVNPKTGSVLSGYTALSAATDVNDVYLGKTLAAAQDADFIDSIDNLVEAVNDLYDINGFALSKKYANALRKIRVQSTYARLYPEIPLNLNVGSIEGVNAAVSGTVNGRLMNSGAGTDILGIMGDFSLIKWGFVRDIRAEVIEYGDPDGAGDLKRLNQVAYRTEAVLAWAVVDPAAFAILHTGTAPSN